MSQCKVLEEYAQFVDICRKRRAKGMDLQEALNNAIDECIEQGILCDFLMLYRSAVLGMLLEEFDVKKYQFINKTVFGL